MPINSGYSFYEYAGDGVTTRFPVQFSLGELKRAYVTCRVDNEVDAFGAPLYRALADVPGDPGMIEILGAVPGVGVPIVFRRIVPKELLLHLYANGSILDYPSLDESHLQLMMALHEVLDGYGLTNVFTDINMNGYKLTNVYSDPDDPDSIATVAFLGTYRQDALDAAVAAADSALEALGYRNAAQVLAMTAGASAQNAAAQVVLCQDQVQLAADQVLLAKGHADDAAATAGMFSTSQTPGASKIPVADAAGKLDAGWLPAINADTVDGFHAQKTAAADRIPVAGAGGELDVAWIPAAVKNVKQTYSLGISSEVFQSFPITKTIMSATSYPAAPSKLAHGACYSPGSNVCAAFRIDHYGNVTVSFAARRNSANASGMRYARVCHNETQIAEFSFDSDSYVTKTCNVIGLVPGDTISIQGRGTSTATSVGIDVADAKLLASII